jgi:hypothetical protein
MIKAVIFPRFCETLGFSGKERSQRFCTIFFALVKLRIESSPKLADIDAASKALLTPKNRGASNARDE